MSSPSTSCPRCGAAASGNFCASCGTSLVQTSCAGCGAALAPGAAFCHRCGRAAGQTAAAPGQRNPVAWLVAAALTVIAIASVVYAMRGRGAPAAANMANVGNAAALSGPAPDISNLSAKERFAKLNDRVMQAAEKGDTTTIFTFWPMALGSYQNLSEPERDVDTRYHMATLYLMVTQYPEVNALADTILITSPNNLLGFYLHGLAAEYQGDSTAARAARALFRQHYPAEITREQPEYLDHRPVLDAYFRQAGGT